MPGTVHSTPPKWNYLIAQLKGIPSGSRISTNFPRSSVSAQNSTLPPYNIHFRIVHGTRQTSANKFIKCGQHQVWEFRIRSSFGSGLLVLNPEWLVGLRCIGLRGTGAKIPYETWASDV